MLGECRGILKGNLHFDFSAPALYVNRLLMKDLRLSVNIGYKAFDAVFLIIFRNLSVYLIVKADAKPLVQERGLLKLLHNGVRLEFRCLKYGSVGIEGDFGAGVGLGAFADNGKHSVHKLRDGMSAVPVFIAVDLPVPANLNDHMGRERVHDGSAYPMKASRYFIGAAPELAARVQNRVHDTGGRDMLGRVDIDGNPSAVIVNGDSAVFLQGDINFIAEAAEMLVDSIIQNLPDKMVESAGSCASDIHAGPLAHCFQPFKNDNLAAGILFHVLPSFLNLCLRSVPV